MKRRALLSTALLTSASLAGCLNNQKPVKLIARNFTEEAVDFSLQMSSAEDALIYDHSATIRAGQSYELPTVERSVSDLETSVSGSTFSYTSSREYEPALFDEPCEEKQLYFRVNSRHIDLDYLCPSKNM